MSTFVLVHGAWGGAWIWRRVTDPLRALGHTVHAVTLSGVGARAHQPAAGIGLRTHIDDVLGCVRSEELRDIVLVGHSYGGMVITGAADALLADDPRSVRQLVYVDAVVPVPGESWSSGHAPDTVAQRMATAQAHGGTLPPPDPAGWGIEGDDRAWLLRRQTPHPMGMYREGLDFDMQRWTRVPRCFVDCHAPALPTIDMSRQRVRQQTGWQLVRIATGHCPMVSTPEALVNALLGAAEPT